MRLVQTLPLVALATAFVLPDPETLEQLSLVEEQHDEPHSLWADISEGADKLFGSLKEKASSIKQDFQDAVHLALEDDDEDTLDIANWPGHGHHGHDGHEHPDKTIYELISACKWTSNFTELVNEYDDIVKLLNSTKANYTLFVPVDSAFEHLPDKKPSKEFVEAVVKYHIGLDPYSGRKLLSTQTIPTALDEKWLGGEPQRLRVQPSLFGIKLNFYSKIITKQNTVKNGVVFGVNHILIPPPFIGRELSLFPNAFSTLLLAYEKTDFVKYIHGVKMDGSTVFAPSNRAFQRLGPRANAFLFNTEKGLGYLKALLKYQIVANATLYSDAYYDHHHSETTKEGSRPSLPSPLHFHVEGADVSHYDLTTLLHDLPIRVDIKRWGAFVRFWVNGFDRVVVRDGVAKNGVVHVVEKVPIPPHKHHGGHGAEEDWSGEIEVDELMERLADYVEPETETRRGQGQEQEDL